MWLSAVSSHHLAAVPAKMSAFNRYAAKGKTSVATLLLRKSTRFHDKKTLDSQKKTLDYKSKLTHGENTQKCAVMPIIDIVQLIRNQRQRKREIAATLVLVCIGH